MTTCPGCGLQLIARSDAAPVGRQHASGECLALLGEVSAREGEHAAVLGRWHQMTVDAYGAQHVATTGPAIGPAFALIGLYLALERGFSGPQVRDAHAHLATPKRDWPRFTPPAGPWPITVADVAAAPDAVAHAARVQQWGASVWEAWAGDAPRVRELTDGLLGAWRPRGS